MNPIIICSVRNIEKYRKAKMSNAVTLDLRCGEGLAVCGYNGCGKTTLLDVLAGIQSPDKGTYEVKTSVGYVMQKSGFLEELSCLDNLRLEARLCGLSKNAANTSIEQYITEFGISHFVKMRVSRCSAGMRAKLAIIMALLAEPGLLLLDEVFNALDDDSHNHVKRVLVARKGNGMGIIMATHSVNEYADLCDYRLNLPTGEVIKL